MGKMASSASGVRRIALIFLFVTQSMWLILISRQYGPVAVPPIFFASFAAVIFLLWRYLLARKMPATILIGVLAGFLAGNAAAFGAEWMRRGMDVFDRPYPLANLYFFPLLCGGWLSGPLFLALVRPAVMPQRR